MLSKRFDCLIGGLLLLFVVSRHAQQADSAVMLVPLVL
jgi:hypothetical protein